MPENFKFDANDDYVRKHLDAEEIEAVIRWQSGRLDYQFSFHTQHDAGWPCYLLEPEGPKRNLPKINLKVPTKPPALLQGESVKDKSVGKDFMEVIRANVPLFQTLARAYYEAEEEDVAAATTWVVAFKCKESDKAKPVLVKLPNRAQLIAKTFWANFKHLPGLERPNCPLHKKAACLQDELSELSAIEAAKVLMKYDGNGEIQDA